MKYSMRDLKALLFSIFLTLPACQSADYTNATPDTSVQPQAPEKPTPETVAEGAINGRAWKFSSGVASVFKRKGKLYLELKLWNQSYSNPCKEPSGSNYQVRLYSENVVGSAVIDPQNPFATAPVIVFSDFTERPSYLNNMVASKGLIRVESLNDGRVVGFLDGGFNTGEVGRTEISGKFDVPLCRQKNVLD